MPNNENAVVALKKITDYLLSDQHPIGKAKAAFFKAFGFEHSNPEAFEAALVLHADERDIEETRDSGFGTKYELRCELKTPDNRNPCIVTVWIINEETDNPNLVTAYPAK